MRRILIPAYTLPLMATVCAAAEREPAGAQWLQTQWQSEQGLPSNTVHAIVQTRDGYLWMGTKRGLVRFDGIHFTVFNGARLTGLADSSVYALCETADGTLWIGGERGGVTRYREGRFTAFPLRNRAAGRWVQSIQASGPSSVLVRTADHILAADERNATVLLPAAGVAGDTVLAALRDRGGTLWLSTAKAGLLRFEDRAFSRFQRLGGPGLRVHQILEDRRGQLWFGANGALIRYTADGEFQTFRFAAESAFNEVHTLHEDREGAIWAGAWGRAVRWKDGRFQESPLENGGTGNEVLAITADRENTIWVGTRNYGLYRLTAARFLTYTQREGLSNNSVKTVLADRGGRVWAGADAGLNLLENGRFRALGGFLARYNVRSLAEDREGNLWIGGWNQIHRWKNGVTESISLNQPGLPAQVATCLLPGSDGSLWIGTRMGLLRLKDGALSRITARDGLSSDFIRAVIESRDGSIWAATSQGGLNRLKDGRINCFGPKDGLFDDGAYQIQEDAKGFLWIGGGGGLYRVAKAGLEARAAGRSAAVTYHAFGESDGMPSVECRGGHQPASGKTRDGRLWFTTIRGLVVVDPDRLRPNEMAPPVVIEEVTVNGEARTGPAIEAPLGDGKVEIRYAGLSFVAPGKLRFRYRLTGFDRDWVSAENRRVATYTNLPSGHFRFQVIASNNDGVWNDTGAGFAFVLHPPFYRSNWFLGLCAALTAALVYRLHHYRMALMESRFAAVLSERTRIAREMHDTILQGMTGISAQLEAVSGALADSPERALAQMERVRAQARGVVEEARRSIWNLRPKPLDDGNLAGALRTSARELTAGSAVQYRVELQGEQRAIPPQVEKNLLRIAQEAIANAMQHARPGCIRIALHFTGTGVSLVVEDDGQGFDASSPRGREAGHYGLLGIRERVDQIGGRLTLRSAPDTGTRIEVAVPRRRYTLLRHAG